MGEQDIIDAIMGAESGYFDSWANDIGALDASNFFDSVNFGGVDLGGLDINALADIDALFGAGEGAFGGADIDALASLGGADAFSEEFANLSPEAFYGFDPSILSDNAASSDVMADVFNTPDLSNLPVDDMRAGLETDYGFGGYDIGLTPEELMAGLGDVGGFPNMLDRENVFNAARDSQLANELIERGLIGEEFGGDALAGYLSPYATPSGVMIDGKLYSLPGKFNAAKDSEEYNKSIDKEEALKGYRAPGATPPGVVINGKQFGTPSPGSPSIPRPGSHPGTNKTGQDKDWLKLLLPLLLMMAARDRQSGGSNAVIPALTASQRQTPYSQQRPEGYRPGQGGIRYFEPMQYTPRRMADGGIVDLLRNTTQPELDPNTQPNLGLFMQGLQGQKSGVGPVDDLVARQLASWDAVEAAKTPADRAWEFYKQHGLGVSDKFANRQEVENEFFKQFGPELYRNYFAPRASDTMALSNVSGARPNSPGAQPLSPEYLASQDISKALGGPGAAEYAKQLTAFNAQKGLSGGAQQQYQDWLKTTGLPSMVSFGNAPANAAMPATAGTATAIPAGSQPAAARTATQPAAQPVVQPTKPTSSPFASLDNSTVRDIAKIWRVGEDAYLDAGGKNVAAIAYSKQLRGTPYEAEIKARAAQIPEALAGGGVIDLARSLAAARREQRKGLLKGRGDGVSDDIPATIGGTQPARLARGEYVVDARTVAELGNGSTDAGAERLDEMRRRVHAKRKKAKVGQDSKAYKHLPA